ncbi:hypothetical protein O181_029974 [Austropuccinia psidii MF-1]|uniref:Secreted protein n=1 Tax=Austropuccinia psidii MF-1 TaxID=1389203 RepID=A0A9Q3CRX7_9BASI|nr:hypothetical protein [Austropuccinia psidii MF-1]
MFIHSFLPTSSLIALLWLSNLFTETEAGVCSILQVLGANHKIGAGFGVATDGSVPRNGNGDTGADATEFDAVENPNSACGRVALHGGKNVDIASFTKKAVASGLPLVYNNGSIPMTVFQVNRLGGGPMTCEYSADATGGSWEPMYMTLNMPGNFGLQSVQNVKYSVVATFNAGAKFTGGVNHNMGLVRCRAGQKNVCGGCFVVQMDGVVSSSLSTPQSQQIRTAVSSVTAGQDLSSQQMTIVINKVIATAKSQGLVASSTANR